jgi:hypothetical protein
LARIKKGAPVFQTIFSRAPSANVINESRKWATALAIVASMALPANAPAFADDKPSGCKPTPEKVEVDTTSPINIGVLASALVFTAAPTTTTRSKRF